jgi:hypothetical protein
LQSSLLAGGAFRLGKCTRQVFLPCAYMACAGQHQAADSGRLGRFFFSKPSSFGS